MTVTSVPIGDSAENHHHDSAISMPSAAPPVELFEAIAFRAVTLALTDQQLIQPHIVGEWLDSLPYERQSRLVVGLYYAGMISHETGCEFVPLPKENQAASAE